MTMTTNETRQGQWIAVSTLVWDPDSKVLVPVKERRFIPNRPVK